jgi:hypothetical protein
MIQRRSLGFHCIPPSTRLHSYALPLVWFFHSVESISCLNICASHRHSHPSTDVPAKDKGGRIPASSDRHAIRISINPRGHHRSNRCQGFTQRPTLRNVARCMHAFTSSCGMLTGIHSLDLWFDHSLLAHRPGCDWRRKCLVWRRFVWRRSESQAGVEVSPAVRLHPINLPPDHHLPRRRSDGIHQSTQRLRRPPSFLRSGSHSHPRVHLLSCQVHNLFSYDIASVLTRSH